MVLWNMADPYFYMRTTADNRVLIGGRDEPFYSPARRDKLIRRKANQLGKDFRKLVPGVAFKQEFSWAGSFASTADGLPYIGVHPALLRVLFRAGLRRQRDQFCNACCQTHRRYALRQDG
jgi:glycine/D-amino acid oxidase-like deaminating enzyme